MDLIRLGKPRIPEPSPDRLARRLPPHRGKKGLIKVGYACNNHCTFCHTLDLRDMDGTGALVMRKIERARELGYGMVVLSGGEVTMRKELLSWAARTAALGMDFGLVTNARMLAYPQLVDQLMRLRLGYVYLSLHGGTARIHNAMVRADAFDETFGAVRQLSGRNLDLTVNTVVTNTNLRHLRDMVDLMLPFDDLTLKFSMTQPKGGASLDHAFRALIPDIEACAEAVRDAIAYGQERVAEQGRGPRFAHDGIPFCLLPGYGDLYDDLRTHGFASMTEAFEPDYFPVDSGATMQTDVCQGCALRGPCPGLFVDYAAMYGAASLRPIAAGTRSNSWTYTPERSLDKLAGGACPVYASPIPYDLARTVFLDEGERLVQYRTESRDFCDAEMRHYKDGLGQLYLDVSDKPAPDDFARDLRKLRLSDACRACDKQSDCTGAWQVVPGDVFTLADRAVRDVIAGVIERIAGRSSATGGAVVDVGCSDDGRYADLWEAAARSGRVRYLGIEPDAERARALSQRFPWAEVRAIPVEELVVPAGEPEGGLEAVLVLRSWNHLEKPAEALAPLVAALRPGGTLLVVDNVAFGLLRTQMQRHRAERSTSIWEHYRNDDSAAARLALSELPLELIAEIPITADGSNQWVLEYRKA